MTGQMAAITGAMASAVVLTSVYFFLYKQERHGFIRIWAFAWSFYTLRFVFTLIADFFPGQIWLQIPLQVASLLSVFFLYWGTQEFLGRKVHRVASLVVLGSCVVWVFFGVAEGMATVWVATPTFFIIGMVFIFLGVTILKSEEFSRASRSLAGWAFIIWGLHKYDYPFIIGNTSLSPWGFLLGWGLEITVAFSVLTMYYRRMSDVLATSESRFRLLAEHAQDIIFRFRFRPNPGFEYVSPSVAAIVGYTPEELYANHRLGDLLVHPEDRVNLIGQLSSSQRIMEPAIYRWIRRDGTQVWIELRNTPVLNGDGKLMAVEGVARDVTVLIEHRQRQERISLELELRNRELEQFASRVAKELRVPLRHVTGFIDVLQVSYGEKFGEHGQHLIRIIQRSIERITEINTELDNLARMSSWTFTPEVLNLTNLADEIARAFSLKEPDRRLTFRIDEELSAWGDRRSLQLLLYHLISNAVTFTRGINNPIITIGTEQNDGKSVFCVQDNGVGIPPEHRANIFLPLYRAHEANFESGTGLGLTTVQKVIESHKGSVWVDEKVSAGARICFTLPEKPAD